MNYGADMNDELKALRKDLLGFNRRWLLDQFVKEYEDQFEEEVREGSGTVTYKGGRFDTFCFGGGISLKKGGRFGWYIRLVHEEEFMCGFRFKGMGSHVTYLDVDDITDIQPHEYGLLKLKYGLTKEELFLPSFLKPFVKDHYYGGGV